MVRLPRSEAQNALEPDEADDVARSQDRAASSAPKTRKPDADVDAPGEEDNLEPSSPVVPVMTGTHFHSLDEKGRIIVPAKLRPSLTSQFWMMLNGDDNIGIYNYQTGLDLLSHFEQQMAEDPDNETIALAVQRTTEAMDYVVVESGWRVLVPEFLRFRAGLEKDVVTRGFLNHAVLLDRAKWEDDQANKQESPEVRRVQASMMRAAAAGAGIKRAATPPNKKSNEDENVGRDAGSADGSGNAPERAEAASSGDGRRSPRVLTLSQLGKGR